MLKDLFIIILFIIIVVYFGFYGLLIQIANPHLTQMEVLYKLLGM